MNDRGVILNQGNGAWAFSHHAQRLARSLWLKIGDSPAPLNYVLWCEDDRLYSNINSFIPLSGIKIASDKRLIAQKFIEYNVATPKTFLIETKDELSDFLRKNNNQQWCLKWPTGCGGMGHQLINSQNYQQIADDYPRPFVVQKFVQMEKPKVYRTYCVAEEIFGWNVRQYAQEVDRVSPWVSHANGARYNVTRNIPDEAKLVATKALKATNLYSSFGCVDLIIDDDKWKALEVGTDGIYNYVDRDFNNSALEDLINKKLALAFWSKIGEPPWGKGEWYYQKL